LFIHPLSHANAIFSVFWSPPFFQL